MGLHDEFDQALEHVSKMDFTLLQVSIINFPCLFTSDDILCD